MSLSLIQQTGLSFAAQPFATSNTCMAQSAGRSLVITNNDGVQRIFPGHSKYISCVACSPDCLLIASTQADCLCLWEAESGAVKAIPLASQPKCIGFSHDSQFIALAYEGLVECYDLQLQKIGGYGQFKRPQAVNFVQWGAGPAGQFFVAPDHNRLVVCTVTFDRATLANKLTYSDITLPASGIDREFTCAGCSYPFVYAGTPSGELAVFNLEQRQFKQLVRYFQGRVQAVICLSPVSTLVASAQGDLVTLSGSEANLLVTSEAALDCQIAAMAPQRSHLYLVLHNGSVVRFELQAQQSPMRSDKQVSSTDLNKQGNVGFLPGQNGYLSSQPAGRRFTVEQQQPGADFVSSFSLILKSLQVVQTFPGQPLTKTALITSKDKEVLIGETDGGLLQAWADGQLLGQVRLNGRGAGVCVSGSTVYAAFDSTLYILQYDGQFKMAAKVPLSTITSVACNQQLIAVGCADGKVFVVDSQKLEICFKITDYGSAVTALAFDLVVPHMLHVANQSVLTTYELKGGVQRLKNRPLPQCVTALAQVPFGRYEVVAACLDGTLKFLDFDMAEPVQIVKLPPGCVVKGKMFLALFGERLVAGGCQMDADELLLTMHMGDQGWEPVGSFLSNGVVISTIQAGQKVYVTGFGGEIAVYGW